MKGTSTQNYYRFYTFFRSSDGEIPKNLFSELCEKENNSNSALLCVQLSHSF